MDKMKNLAKGGWHPENDRKISKDTWKSDLKGIATGKKQDPYAYARDHQSAPLSSLKDPASFAPPPKHKDYYPNGATSAITSSPQAASPTSISPARQGPQGGWGSTVPAPSRRREQEEAEIASKSQSPPVPYRANTSGLRTDNLPKPPVRRVDTLTSSPTSFQPRTTPRPNVPLPARQNSGPPPILPPRQNEYPDEYTPAPPPPYSAPSQSANPDIGVLNPVAINNLSRAGVSVPGLGLGARPADGAMPVSPQASQVNELQQRFARMNSGAAASSIANTAGPSIQAVAATKKPPPPPPKKSGLADVTRDYMNASSSAPPLPMASKPRPP